MGDRYVKSDDNKKILHVDGNKYYGWAMSESPLYGESEMWHGHPDLYMKNFGEIINTSDDSDIGYFLETDLRYPENIEEKTKNFPSCPENKVFPKDTYNDYMKKIKATIYIKTKKLICDWTDEKKFLIHYRMLKFYV